MIDTKLSAENTINNVCENILIHLHIFTYGLDSSRQVNNLKKTTKHLSSKDMFPQKLLSSSALQVEFIIPCSMKILRVLIFADFAD